MKTAAGAGPRGYDGGKKINGRKRHIAVDVESSPIVLDVHEADVRDRDGAPPVILEMLEKAPRVEKLFADGGYAGAKLEGVLADPGVSGLMGIVEKPEETKGFTVLRRRRVVERSFAWMGRCRRLAKDVERTLARSVAWAKLAACRFMMQRVARCWNAGNSAKIATI